MGLIVRKMDLDDVDAVCVIEEESFSMPWHRESFIEPQGNDKAEGTSV